MKRMKQWLSFGTAAVLAAAAAAAAAVPAGAAVIVEDGDFQYTYQNGAWQLYGYTGESTEVVLPDSFSGMPVTEVAEQCFLQSGITAVTVPDSYVTIGSYAFYGCESLHTVTLPSSVTSIGAGAFADSGLVRADLSQTQIGSVSSFLMKGCAALESVSLPPTVGSIGEAAFAGSGLTAVDIPAGVTQLDRCAFADTASLAAVSLHEGLQCIGESCFENAAVSEITLPESLQTIGASAFRGNAALRELYIPDGVTDIGGYALYPMSVQGTVCVRCFQDSYAAVYCYENFVNNTVAYPKVYGDANLDGKVNIHDVTAVQRSCAELATLIRPAQITADVTHDGAVSVADATLVQRYLAEFEDAVLY